MARRKDSPVELCSFCSKPPAEVGKLVQGPGVCICRPCTLLASEILEDDVPAPEVIEEEPRSSRLVLDDGTVIDVDHPLREVVSKLGRDDSSLVAMMQTDGQRVAIRRQRVSRVVALPVAGSDPGRPGAES